MRIKEISQGGSMKKFFNCVHPSHAISVFWLPRGDGLRQLNVGVEKWEPKKSWYVLLWFSLFHTCYHCVKFDHEHAFLKNRALRMEARAFVDLFVLWVVMPSYSFQQKCLPPDGWHPIALFVSLGILRSCAPCAVSFQESRASRGPLSML